MSDTTTFKLVFAAIPDDEVPAATELVNEYRLTEDPGLWPPEEGFEAVELGTHYADGEARTDILDELGPALAAAAPGAMWFAYTEPAYESLGVLRMHVPGMDDFVGECDADGNVVLKEWNVSALLANLPDDMTVREAREAIDDGVRRATGRAWWDPIRAVLNALPGWGE